ncbi:MAG TPA: sensor histidine kinase [Bryobacteraceae bacterium]
MAGLAVILSGAIVYSAYTAWQIRNLRTMQAEMVDRNRTDSLLLLRIQNDLNALSLAMRDMLESSEPYGLTAWESQFRRIRSDLEDAIERESHFAPATRTADQSTYLSNSMAQFWDSLDRNFVLARTDEKEARARVRLSLQARQEALSSAVSRLLIQNNEREEQAASEVQQIYGHVERNVYIFFAVLLVVVVITSAYLLQFNRKVFDQVSDLSRRRSELAQQLITTQESTFRSISRELHDDFGQILTAIGLMLQRSLRLPGSDALREELRDVHGIVQQTLDKVRALSQALHPVMLEEVGLESALDAYIPVFEKRTGIQVEYEKTGHAPTIDGDVAIHTYRVLQEALNNVARHAKSATAKVRLQLSPTSLTLEVEDSGPGFERSSDRRSGGGGMGLVSMRERAGILHGAIEFINASPQGGGLVRLTVPLAPVAGSNREESHVAV